MSVGATAVASSPEQFFDRADIVEKGHPLRVRTLAWSDSARQTQYQQMRGRAFVTRLNWSLSLDAEGREQDRYDTGAFPGVLASCVYAIDDRNNEHLLGGVRTFRLREWTDSMIFNEFSSIGMVPQAALVTLKRSFPPEAEIEITRLCAETGRRSPVQSNVLFDEYHAADWLYSAVYARAASLGCRSAVAITSKSYTRLMRRSGFKFQQLYEHQVTGDWLVRIDLYATVQELRSRGFGASADRFIALSPPHYWDQGPTQASCSEEDGQTDSEACANGSAENAVNR